jgi:hypothetical protein
MGILSKLFRHHTHTKKVLEVKPDFSSPFGILYRQKGEGIVSRDLQVVFGAIQLPVDLIFLPLTDHVCLLINFGFCTEFFIFHVSP